MLEGINDGTSTRPRFMVEDWYRPHLGRFLCVNKDGVLCHAEHSGPSCPQLNYGDQRVPSSMPGRPPEMGDDTEGDAENESKSSAVPIESLVYNDLMGEIERAGILWPNPAQAPSSGHHTSQTPDATDGLVLSSFLRAAILSSYLRNWHYAFYDNFLNQISDLTRQPPP